MTRTIDFYFDFPSPYAYLAHTQLPRIASEHGATVAYHPFRILELMKIVGNRPTTIECKNKGKYAGVDLQRWELGEQNFNASTACSTATFSVH